VRSAPTVGDHIDQHEAATAHGIDGGLLTLGAALVSMDEARAIVSTWLTTPMREPRYIRRLAKIRDLEKQGR